MLYARSARARLAKILTFPPQEATSRSARRRTGQRRPALEALEPRIALDGTPIISEFMALNSHTLADEDGDFSDWLEIYNPTSAAVNLGGWHLTDKTSDLTEWTFPSINLDPGHFQLVFASGKDRAVAGSELHTNFKLAGDGEFLALVEPDGTTIASQFSPSFPQQYQDVSYGDTFTAGTQTTTTLTVSGDTWIREKQPNTNWENDSISVWATDGGAFRRYAITEWDLSGITQPIVGAHIELYDENGGAVVQTAYLIPNGITGMTWNTYLANDKPYEIPLTSLGSGSFGAGGIGSYFSTSSASAADLAQLNNLRTTTGKVTIVYKATSGARDWGDKDHDHQPARLVLTLGTPGTLVGDLRYFSTPTPGSANQGGAVGLLPQPTISIDHGIYAHPFDTVITTPTPGATIVYTTNGSDPTLTNGTQVLAPDGNTPPQTTLRISHTTTLRVAAFVNNYIPSNITTDTYIFLSDVITQSPTGQAPSGWPSASINGQVFNYGMDPDIVGTLTVKGDFNGDKQVTTADYNILTSHFSQTVPAGTLGDIDGNGLVDLQDFALFKQLYNDFQSGAVTYNGGTAVTAALTAIPTISLVTNLSNLFDPATGIYVNAAQSGSQWERPVSVELINPDGSPGFQIDAGVRIRGNFSASGANPKHGFRLFFDSNEGALDYPLFGADGTNTYEKLDLRTDENDNWAFTGSTQDTFVNDVFARDTQFAMGDPSTRSDYYQLYINGVYWGLYQSQERPSADYAASYFGGDSSDYDVIKSSGSDGGYTTEATDGNLDAWNQLWTLTQGNVASNAVYYQMQGLNPDGTRNPAYPVLLDVDNLIDYMLVNFYMDNEDAPLSLPLNNNESNNWYGIRNHNGDTGFQFFSFDSEQTLLSKYNVGGVNGDRTGPFHGTNEHNFTYSNPQWIHQALMANAEYRLEFADRVQKAFYDGGALTVQSAQQNFQDRANEINSAIVGESARWGDAYSTRVNNPLTKTDWQNAVNADLNYFAQRGTIVLSQLAADGLVATVTAPTYSTHGGTVPPGTTITLSAPQGTIYYTLDGSDPRLIGGAVSPTAMAYSGPISISHSLTVNARALNGGVWSAVNTAAFNLTVPDLRITELMYHPGAAPAGSPYTTEDFEYVELQNIGTSTINLTGMQFVDGITFTFPSMTLNAGQYVVVAKNLAAFASRYAGVPAIGPYSGNLSNGGELLTLDDATGATIQSFTYADNWYPTTDGSGYSLVVVDPLAAVSTWGSAGNWRASTNLNGSPGAIDPSAGSGSEASSTSQSVASAELPITEPTIPPVVTVQPAHSDDPAIASSSTTASAMAASTTSSVAGGAPAVVDTPALTASVITLVNATPPTFRFDDTAAGASASLLASMTLSRATGVAATDSDAGRRTKAIDAIYQNHAAASDDKANHTAPSSGLLCDPSHTGKDIPSGRYKSALGSLDRVEDIVAKSVSSLTDAYVAGALSVGTQRTNHKTENST